MGTSNSGEVFRARADVFAGRPNPEWVVDESVLQKLFDLWTRMRRSAEPRQDNPKLGYRGVYLEGPENRVWHAYDGIVTLTEHGIKEARRDKERRFEKTLLSSAPAGLLPTPFLGDLIRAKKSKT